MTLWTYVLVSLFQCMCKASVMFSRLNGVASKMSGVLLIELKVVQWSSIQITPLRLVEASPPQCALQLQVQHIRASCYTAIELSGPNPDHLLQVKANFSTRLHRWTGRNRQWFHTFLLVHFGIYLSQNL